MTLLRHRVDEPTRRAPSTPKTSPSENGFDLRAILAARGHEGYALQERYVNPQMPRVLRTLGFDREWVSAEGPYLFDREGNAYLDFLAGFGVFALGRCIPPSSRRYRTRWTSTC